MASSDAAGLRAELASSFVRQNAVLSRVLWRAACRVVRMRQARDACLRCHGAVSRRGAPGEAAPLRHRPII